VTKTDATCVIYLTEIGVHAHGSYNAAAGQKRDTLNQPGKQKNIEAKNCRQQKLEHRS